MSFRRGKRRKHTTLRLWQAQSGRRLQRKELNQNETKVAGSTAAARGLWSPRPRTQVLSYFSQPLGTAGQEPRPAVQQTARAVTQGKGLALTPHGAQQQLAALSRVRRTTGPHGGLRVGEPRPHPPGQTHIRTHSPADVVKRGQPDCVPRYLNLSTFKKRLPEELSLRAPHIATERIHLSSGPSNKRSPTERFH